jgi:hypothetical protein
VKHRRFAIYAVLLIASLIACCSSSSVVVLAERFVERRAAQELHLFQWLPSALLAIATAAAAPISPLWRRSGS